LRPADYKSAALPTELRQQISDEIHFTSDNLYCQVLFSFIFQAVLAVPITFIDYSTINLRCLYILEKIIYIFPDFLKNPIPPGFSLLLSER
uniref:hypothetical protein n=1 Tax=uncultured Allisonella sp. TaxID=339338 RepID=UPI002585C26B